MRGLDSRNRHGDGSLEVKKTGDRPVLVHNFRPVRVSDEVTAEDAPFWSSICLKTILLSYAQDSEWFLNPIDQLILAKPKNQGLTPAGEADRRDLGRRIWFNMTGVVPELDQIESFVDSDAPFLLRSIDGFPARESRFW